MIISASRRTDIPAFFGDWFVNRIEEGYFVSKNPFNPSQVKKVSLLQKDVDIIVFWSKNPQPFIKYLDYLDDKGYNYYFQFTFNDYPKDLEPKVPSFQEGLDTFIELSKRLGPERVLWRYDPIAISSITPAEYHLEKVYLLAGCLSGYTKRLTISFLDFYGKVEGRLNKISRETGIRFTDIGAFQDKEALLELAGSIGRIAGENGMKVYSCAEAVDLSSCGIERGSCIDEKLIKKLSCIVKNIPRDRNQRRECLCAQSVDMGVYNTCSFQCCYCYANYSSSSISKNLKRFSVNNASLVI